MTFPFLHLRRFKRWLQHNQESCSPLPQISQSPRNVNIETNQPNQPQIHSENIFDKNVDGNETKTKIIKVVEFTNLTIVEEEEESIDFKEPALDSLKEVKNLENI